MFGQFAQITVYRTETRKLLSSFAH